MVEGEFQLRERRDTSRRRRESESSYNNWRGASSLVHRKGGGERSSRKLPKKRETGGGGTQGKSKVKPTNSRAGEEKRILVDRIIKSYYKRQIGEVASSSRR